MRSSLCNQRWSHIKKRSILKKCALWKCGSELSEKGYYTDVMIHDSCVTHLGKYDINTTLCIIDTGNKAFIYPIFQIIKQSSILRSSCCMTRVEPRSELLTNVKTNDVCARFYNNHFIMHCYYFKWSHITYSLDWAKLTIFYWLRLPRKSIKTVSQAPTYKTGGAKQGSAQRRPATTSFKEIWTELRTRILKIRFCL